MKTASAPSYHSGSKTLYALAVLVLAAAGWAYFTPIDISVQARGIVRSNGDSVRVISEASGRIRQVYIQEGSIARQVYDESRLALEQAEADHARLSAKSTELKQAQAEAHLRDMTAGATPLRAELAALYYELEQTRLEIDRLSLTSPVDGQVTSLASLHAGEILSAGAAIAAIVPHAQALVIESWLPTAERSFVKPDQQVRLQTESFPPEQYNAFDGTI